MENDVVKDSDTELTEEFMLKEFKRIYFESHCTYDGFELFIIKLVNQFGFTVVN